MLLMSESVDYALRLAVSNPSTGDGAFPFPSNGLSTLLYRAAGGIEIGIITSANAWASQ